MLFRSDCKLWVSSANINKYNESWAISKSVKLLKSTMLLISFTNRINISGDNGYPCFNPIATLNDVHIGDC